MPLPEKKTNLYRHWRFWWFRDVPASDMAVSHAGMHVHHEHDHESAQVVDPCQSWSGLGYGLSRLLRQWNRGFHGRYHDRIKNTPARQERCRKAPLTKRHRRDPAKV